MSAWNAFDRCVAAAFSVVRDEDTARDIATEVCGAAEFTHNPDGTVPPSAASLSTLARWRALDYTRKGKLEIVRGYDIERAADSAETPEQALEAKQRQRALEDKLGEVEAFVIGFSGEGFSDADIAQRLNKTEVAVRQIRSRARRKLIDLKVGD